MSTISKEGATIKIIYLIIKYRISDDRCLIFGSLAENGEFFYI